MPGMVRQVMRRWVMANPRDAAGTPMPSTMAGVSAQPSAASSSDSPPTKAMAQPTTRFTAVMSRAPRLWPMATPAAVPMPMAEPITMYISTVAVATAVSASAPRLRPTQMAPQVPVSECSRLVTSSGSAKRASVGAIGPLVKRPAAA